MRGSAREENIKLPEISDAGQPVVTRQQEAEEVGINVDARNIDSNEEDDENETQPSNQSEV